MTIPHSTLVGDQLHGPFRRTFADAAARTGDAGPYNPTESMLGGSLSPALALQADTRAVYVLQNHSPVTWVEASPSTVGGGGAPIETSTPPADLGTASPGVAATVSASDHVHNMPTAGDVGAYTQAETDAAIAAGGGAPIETSTPPADLGVAAVGSALTVSASDHVHNLPTPADIGAYTTAETDAAIAASGGGAPSGPAGGALQGTYPNPGIADGAVDALAILDGNVTAAKLDDGAVTAAKIDANAVTTQAVANGAVTLAKLADINANSLLGNNTGSTGPVVELDPAAVRALLALPPAVAESIVSGTFDATQESFTSAIEFTSVTDVVTVEVAGSGNAVDGALRWQASDDGLTGWADAGGAFDTYTPGVDFAQVFDHALPKFYRVGFVPNPAGTGTLGYTLTRAGY